MRKERKQVAVHDFTLRLRQELPHLQQEYAVQSLGLFGSYVRGEQRKGSDLDVLIEFSQTPGIFRILELERMLSSLLGVTVDLVHKDAVKPAIGRRILHEIQPI